MKKMLLLLLFSHISIFPLTNHYSKTFMFTKPIHYNVIAQQDFWHNILYNNENVSRDAQFIILYQQSSNNPNTEKSRLISQYFLMKDKSELTVKGDEAIGGSKNEAFDESRRDIRAEWLNLPSNFDGSFTLFPQQKQIGFVADFKKDLDSLLNSCQFATFWIGASVSILSVENRINFRQVINKQTSTETILNKFNSPEMCFQKFYNTASLGFTDIQLKFGSNFLFKYDVELNNYTYLLLPLAQRQSGKIFFEAVRGFNGHGAIGTVFNLQIPLNNKCSPYLISFYGDIDSIYLFRNKQFRTFDLKEKPFSRYLLLNKKDGQRNIPAINILTQEVKVRPYNMVDLSAGLRFQQGSFELEVGYCLWAHGSEELEFDEHFDVGLVKFEENQYGIAGDGQTPEGFPATASKSTIAFKAQDDVTNNQKVFIPIRAKDLDFDSGLTGSTLVHRIHVSIGAIHKSEQFEGFFGFGAFCEFPQNNSALQNIGFWAKVGSSF